MKSIGFFLTVFVSMLVVFLIATGEVNRWFAASERPQLAPLDPGGGPEAANALGEKTKNIFEFPFYDVERAELKFVVQAEFSQEQFPANATLDDINHLVLRDGVIKVPHAAQQFPDQVDSGTAAKVKEAIDGLVPPGNAKPWKLLLKFKHAVYQRSAGSTGKGPLIHLTDGTGTADDDARFTFEELVFREAGQGTFSLSSSKPVSLQNRSVGIRSPNGLEGILEEQGAKSFTLTPPVSTLMDTARSVSLAEGQEAKASSSTPAPLTESEEKVAVTCAGPLDIFFEGQKRDANGADSSQPTTTRIVFQDNVVIYPVDGGTKLEALPAPEGNRFECQHLEVEIMEIDGQPRPRHALATWKGGRVRAFVKRQSNGALDKIECDRLEWTTAAGKDGAPDERVAVLHGRPTFSGDDIQLQSDRAIFYVTEDRVLFETVEATMTYRPESEEHGAESTAGMEGPLAPPPLETFWQQDAPDWAPRSPERSRNGGQDGGPRKPQVWDMLAPRVELFLHSPQGQSGTRTRAKSFSRLVASSERPGGVVITGRLPRREKDGGGKDGGPESFRATSTTLTYVEAEKKATLEGTEALKPRFTYGDSYLWAQKIHIFQEEKAVRFEGEVRGKLEDAVRGKVEDDQYPFEVEADLLRVWFDEGRGELRSLVASGTAARPVRLSTLTSPVYRFIAPQFSWDQQLQTAWMEGSPGEPGESAGEGSKGSLARVELEQGELVADRIVFNSKTWTAYGTENVSLRGFDKDSGSEGPQVEVNMGKARVEFFEKMEKRGGGGEGSLGKLASVKSFDAARSSERRIELRGESFVGRAQKCTWDSASQKLRFFGTDPQEIELLDEDFHGPILAREIIYDAATNRIVLDGSVHGELVQTSGRSESGGKDRGADLARIEPVSHRPGGDSMRWKFSTPSLEIQLSQVAGQNVAKFEYLHAKEKVDLENVERGIHFHGDDLLYTHATRKVRIFSRHGLPQILVFDRGATAEEAREEVSGETPGPVGENGKEPANEKRHKIYSQEILILFLEDPRAVPQRGEPGSWLHVHFKRDVKASFYLPPRSAEKRAEGLGPIWKMEAEGLTLRVDPSQPADEGDAGSARRIIPWARANGNVVFSTGAWRAEADQAIFDDAAGQLTLRGAPDARLLKGGELQCEEHTIQLIQVDGEAALRWYSRSEE